MEDSGSTVKNIIVDTVFQIYETYIILLRFKATSFCSIIKIYCILYMIIY